MKKKIICIDLTNVVPGTGGTGGGIVTYAVNLVLHIDLAVKKNDVEFICLINSKFKNFPRLRNVNVKEVKVNNKNIISRLFWLHVRLPLFCFFKGATVIHRIIAELPLISPCRSIVTLHDFMFDLYLQNTNLKKYLSIKQTLKYRLLSSINTQALRSSHSIIVLSDTVREEVTAKFPVLGRKTRVTKMASQYDSDESFVAKIPADKIRIGMVAAFFPHKGHLRMLRLAKFFLDLNFTAFEVYFRGSHVDQVYVEEVKNEIRMLELDNFVFFEAFESDSTLQQIYAKYDVVAMLSEYEGFGLPVLEAQANSSVVLCSDIPIFREILKNSAIFIKPDFSLDDVRDLIKKLKNEQFLKELKTAGKKNLERYSWARMAEETEEVYDLVS